MRSSVRDFGTRGWSTPLAAFLLLTNHALPLQSQQASLTLSNEDRAELRKEIELVEGIAATSLELTNEARAKTIVDLYREAANEANISLDDDAWYAPVRRNGHVNGELLRVPNLVVRVPGKDPNKIIVVGAHLDKVQAGKGAIDDWSGCIAVSNLFEQLIELPDKPNHTILFVCFAYEESGLWGSQCFVDDLRSQGLLDNVVAMLNLECLGVSDAFIWENGSSPELIKLAEHVAEHVSKVSITSRPLSGVGADSVPFLNAGIPAITVDSLSAADFGKIHSSQDNVASINKGRPNSDGYDKLFDVFQFAFDYLMALDSSPTSFHTAARSYELPSPLPLLHFHPKASGVAPHRPVDDVIDGANDARDAVTRANAQWSEAITKWSAALAAGDDKAASDAKELLADAYSPDGMLVTPDGTIVSGREQIVQFYEGLAKVAKQASLETESLTSKGRLAYENGRYVVRFRSGKPSGEEGRSFVVWHIDRDAATSRANARFFVDIWYPVRQIP